jgi:hypothetical protein
MARQTHAYLGSGKVKMREVGAATAFLDIGNVSALTFGAQLDAKSLKNFRTPGGGTYAKVDRVSMTVHDLNGENLARATGGAASSTAAGTVTDEEVVAYKGGTTPLTRAPSAITTVEPIGGGTAYTADSDYIITPGGLEIPDDSTIPDPVAGAANIQVTYANTLQTVVQSMVNSGKEYEILFEGLNEAESDLPVIVQAYRVKFSPAQAVNFIGDDFAALELAGEALQDVNKTGVGISQYWKTTIVE